MQTIGTRWQCRAPTAVRHISTHPEPPKSSPSPQPAVTLLVKGGPQARDIPTQGARKNKVRCVRSKKTEHTSPAKKYKLSGTGPDEAHASNAPGECQRVSYLSEGPVCVCMHGVTARAPCRNAHLSCNTKHAMIQRMCMRSVRFNSTELAAAHAAPHFSCAPSPMCMRA